MHHRMRSRFHSLAALVGALSALQCAPDAPADRPPVPTAELPPNVAVCQSCHQQTVASFVRTAHFQTSAEATGESVKGHFEGARAHMATRAPGVYFAMSARADGFYQTAVDSNQRRTQTERMDIVVGSARRGQSFLFWKNRVLFQLPVSYVTVGDGWINSPGYTDGQVDFGRLIVPRCLECHSTTFTTEATPAGVVYGRAYVLGITCAKCHGGGATHVAQASAGDRATGGPTHIRNPARFTRERQLDTCALCHSGNRPPRGPPFTYQPGDDLATYLAAPPTAVAAAPDVHGDQVGSLRRSKCFDKSPDMTCSTCHNVHETQRDVAAMARKCLACHQQTVHPRAAEIGDRMLSACVDCHMPVSLSNALQINTPTGADGFSIRSHRIAVYP